MVLVPKETARLLAERDRGSVKFCLRGRRMKLLPYENVVGIVDNILLIIDGTKLEVETYIVENKKATSRGDQTSYPLPSQGRKSLGSMMMVGGNYGQILL